MNMLLKNVYGLWIIITTYQRGGCFSGGRGRVAYCVDNIYSSEKGKDYRRALDLARKWWRR